jgi:hypothetical protein
VRLLKKHTARGSMDERRMSSSSTNSCIPYSVSVCHRDFRSGLAIEVVMLRLLPHFYIATLQAHSDVLLSAISSDSGTSLSTAQVEEELAYTLQTILKVLSKFPTNLSKVAIEAATHASVSEAGSQFELGGGVVVIMGSVAREYHPPHGCRRGLCSADGDSYC